jgi:hypothetical protein
MKKLRDAPKYVCLLLHEHQAQPLPAGGHSSSHLFSFIQQTKTCSSPTLIVRTAPASHKVHHCIVYVCGAPLRRSSRRRASRGAIAVGASSTACCSSFSFAAAITECIPLAVARAASAPLGLVRHWFEGRGHHPGLMTGRRTPLYHYIGNASRLTLSMSVNRKNTASRVQWASSKGYRNETFLRNCGVFLQGGCGTPCPLFCAELRHRLLFY